MAVALRSEAFDPWLEVAAHPARAGLRPGSFGATAVFVGTMRDHAGGEDVDALFLEHYPGMTERELGRIVEEAQGLHPIDDALVVHRTGQVQPDEVIVLVAVWSAHRAAAFAACRFIMEALKSRAPFWKHERAGGRWRWVECNTPGEP